MVKMLMSYDICLSRLYGIHLNLRRLVVFLVIRSLILVRSILDLIISLFSVTYVILLTMLLIRVLIMHVVLNLTLCHSRTILILS